MTWDANKEKELELILDRFALFIRSHILKYRIANLGIDIEDVSQEVKIRIWKVLRSEKKILNYSSYIRKVVESSVIDQVRKFRRDEDILKHEKAQRIAESANPYPSDPWLEGKDPREIVFLAIENLIESRRTVVRLYLMNMSIEEIAKSFRWSLNKTRNLLYRGLSDLRGILKQRLIEFEDENHL